MSWQRISILMRFDIHYSLIRLKGWVFLVPFSLYWFLIFYQFNINKDLIDKLQTQEAVGIFQYYGTDTALKLFSHNPPSVSLFFVILLITTPFFTVLASYDQFSSDLGSGFFRFLNTRCTRLEIFFARFLSAFSIIASALLIITIICSTLAIKNDDYDITKILFYSLQIYLIALIYALAFIAYMSVISSLVKSPLASIFVGLLGCTIVMLFNLFSIFTQGQSFIAHLLAIGEMRYLFELDTKEFFLALAILPIYILVYAGLGFRVFNQRNL